MANLRKRIGLVGILGICLVMMGVGVTLMRGSSAARVQADPTYTLAAPQNLRIENNFLLWNAVPGATHYGIYAYTLVGGTYQMSRLTTIECNYANFPPPGLPAGANPGGVAPIAFFDFLANQSVMPSVRREFRVRAIQDTNISPLSAGIEHGRIRVDFMNDRNGTVAAQRVNNVDIFIEHGQQVSAPSEAPAGWTGWHTVAGWRRDAHTGSVWNFSTPVTNQHVHGVLRLVPLWAQNQGRIAFNLNGGTGNISVSGLGPTVITTDASGGLNHVFSTGDRFPESISVNLERDGHHLRGFYIEIDGEEHLIYDAFGNRQDWAGRNQMIMMTNNATLAQYTIRVHWTPNAAAINFTRGDASVVANVTGDLPNISGDVRNTGATLNAANFNHSLVRPGWTFGGWRNMETGGIISAPHQVIIPVHGRPVEFRAVWNPIVFEVYVDNNPLAGSADTHNLSHRFTHTNGTALPLSLGAPPRPNPVARFIGIFTAPVGGTPIFAHNDARAFTDIWDVLLDASVNHTVVGGRNIITLYAQWDDMNLDIGVSFITRGGSTINRQEGRYGFAFNIPTTSKAGHTHLGWSAINPDIYSSATVDFLPGANFSITASITRLYAVWERWTHTITFNAGQGGQALIENPNYNPHDATCLEPRYLNQIVGLWNTYFTFPNAQRTGWDFVGWARVNNATQEIDYKAGETSMYIQGEADGHTISFYAVWERIYIDATLDVNGGVLNGSGTYVIAYGNRINTPDPTREGHDFVGWQVFDGTNWVPFTTGSDGTALTEFTAGMDFVEREITIRAAWDIHLFNVDFWDGWTRGTDTDALLSWRGGLVPSHQYRLFTDVPWNTEITLGMYRPTVGGQRFRGWAKGTYQSGDHLFQPGDTILVQSAFTLNGVWEHDILDTPVLSVDDNNILRWEWDDNKFYPYGHTPAHFIISFRRVLRTVDAILEESLDTAEFSRYHDGFIVSGLGGARYFDLNSLTLPEGEYFVRIQAISGRDGQANSLISPRQIFRLDVLEYADTGVTSPELEFIGDFILFWNHIELVDGEVTHYRIYADGVAKHTITVNDEIIRFGAGIDLRNLFLPEGAHEITVVAITDIRHGNLLRVSFPSDSVIFVSTGELPPYIPCDGDECDDENGYKVPPVTGNNISMPMILGIVFGVVAAIAIGGGIAMFVIKKKKGTKKSPPAVKKTKGAKKLA